MRRVEDLMRGWWITKRKIKKADIKNIKRF